MIELDGEPIVLTTSRLLLRPLRESDVSEAYVEGLNDPRVNEYLVAVKAVRQTRSTVEAFVAANRADPAGMLLGMFTKAEGTLIGTIRLHAVEATHRTATLGICLFLPSCWGLGYSAEAIDAVSAWALQHLPVRYIEAACYAANPASLRAFLKGGFSVAAQFEDKYLLNGQPVPVIFLKRISAQTGEV